MPLPHVPLPQGSMDGINVSGPSNPDNTAMLLNYSNDQLTDPLMWDSAHSKMLIFESESLRVKDMPNIALSLSRIARFVKSNPLNGGTALVDFATISEII